MSGKVFERFWSFCDLPRDKTDPKSANLISSLNSILSGSHDKENLVAQCYDGASVMSVQHRGVQSTLLRKHTPMLIMLIAMSTNLILFCNRLFYKLTM